MKDLKSMDNSIGKQQAHGLSHIARWILHCYPRAWRDRYEQEMGEVLHHLPITLWTLFDLLLGALDARLHPDLLPERITTMTTRLRNSEIMIFCAFIVYAVAWFAIRFVRDPLPPWEAAIQAHPALLTALMVVDGFGLLALAALVAGGIPILYVALRNALRNRTWQSFALFAIPFVFVGILVICALLLAGPSIQHVDNNPNAPLTPLAVVLQLVLLLLLLGTIVGSTWSIALLVRRSQFSERLLRIVFMLAAIMTFCIVAGLVASIVLTWLAVTQAPQIAGSPGNMEVTVIVMAIATVLAVIALMRGWRTVVGA